MSGNTAARFNVLTLSEAELVDSACDRFEAAWRSGDWPCIEAYLDSVSPASRPILLIELLKLELELRMDVGETPTALEYCRRFPDHVQAINEVFRAVREPSGPLSTERSEGSPLDGSHPDAEASTISLGPVEATDLAQVDAALGRQLGDYLIVDRIGSGGMGVVYRALQRSAGRFVALKLIKADWWGDSTHVSTREAAIRFRNEAQATAQLEHDHIVPVYEVGHIGGLLYFSMRLIKGRSLGQMILSDGPLPPRRAAYYMEAIARAIQYAHDKKVLHRDIKPGNVMVDEQDRPFLIDLGLAKSLEATEFTTMTGKALGTAEYMSPEQARGMKEVDFAADVYGLGATLFALLTGRAPFWGPNPVAVLRKVLDEEPVWPRERDKPVGYELKAICLKCLEKDPGQRIPTAGKLAAELRKYLTYERCEYTLPGPGRRLVKWVRRQPWRAAAASLALIASLAVGATWGLTVHHHQTAAAGLIRDVQKAPLADLPEKIEHIASHRQWVVPRLRELLSRHLVASEARTRILLALLPFDPDQAKELGARLCTCNLEEHRVIRDALRSHWTEITPGLRRVLDNPRSAAAERIRAAAALIALDGPQTPAAGAWALLRLAPDPDTRVALLEWLVQSKVDPNILAARLEKELDQSVRRQLVQALGALGQGAPPPEVSQDLLPRLLRLYSDDPDPGVHSSLAYLLRRWGMENDVHRLDADLAARLRGGREWYVNSVGLTMVIIDVPENRRPLPPEPEQIPARFAIATTEVPLALFQQFDHEYAARRFAAHKWPPPADPDCPADSLSYFDAGRFCNFLSERERIPQEEWCYQPGKSKDVMILKPDYMKRGGYRLPTIAEWEFAARAGTTTDRYFGQDTKFSAAYAWHAGNTDSHAQRIGWLRPNDFGLFDVIGNVAEWCRNPCASHDQDCPLCTPNPGIGPCGIQPEASRGGAFNRNAQLQRATNRGDQRLALEDERQPNLRFVFMGFRVVKSDLEAQHKHSTAAVHN